MFEILNPATLIQIVKKFLSCIFLDDQTVLYDVAVAIHTVDCLHGCKYGASQRLAGFTLVLAKGAFDPLMTDKSLKKTCWVRHRSILRPQAQT